MTMKKKMTIRKEVMECPYVNQLAKDILEMSKGKDCGDAFYDVQLAAAVLRSELICADMGKDELYWRDDLPYFTPDWEAFDGEAAKWNKGEV